MEGDEKQEYSCSTNYILKLGLISKINVQIFRSLKGLVRCGNRLVGKCLCLESNISSQSQKRHVGTVIGTECHCKVRFCICFSEYIRALQT